MKKMKVALIGAGNIANSHLQAYRNIEDAEVYAICDINEKRLNETADEFGIARRYTDVDSMLDALPELDAADVCVWNVNHAECTIKALNAGLDTICEKPLAYNTSEAIKMKEAADKAGKLLMVGFCSRFSDEGRIAKDFIDKGYLGEIYFAKGIYTRRHGNPGGWFSNKELSGGGPVIDLAVHVVDFTRYLMGNPKPVSVYGVTFDKLGRRDFLKTAPGWVPKDASPDDPCTVEDFATAIIRYENGSAMQLETAYSLNGEAFNKRQLFGTKAGLDLTSGVKMFSVVNDFLADIDIKTNNFKEHASSPIECELKHFTDCVLNGTKCLSPAQDGIEMMKILDGIYESAKTGHEVIL